MAETNDTVTNDELTEAQRKLLAYCKELGWGRCELIIKDGEPVMILEPRRDVKLD